VSVPRLGRWATVAFSLALLWIFGFAAEARAEVTDELGTIATVADTTVTEGTTATEDATSGGLSGDGSTIADEGTSTPTEPVDTSTGTEPVEPTPTTEPTDPTPTTDPEATAPPTEPTPAPEPITPVTDPTPTTDPEATAPPTEPTPAPEPITPIAEPTPTTETPLDAPPPPVSPQPAGSGPPDSIVVIDESLPSALLSPSQGTTIEAFIGMSSPATDRGSELTPVPKNPGNGRPSPAAPDLPRLPAPHHPSAPANPAPGGAGGTGSSALGVLAALFALAFAGLLGEVLPVSVAALRPPDLAFHLKRPG
jgi:hypothetical protein